MLASLIIKGEYGYGDLYLGSFKSVLDHEFVQKNNIFGVLNTVGDNLFTKSFGKKLKSTYESVVESEQLNLLCMQWQDSLQYDISHEDLKKSVHFIHDIRRSGKSVIVHCAQGKSRSATAVVAYIMASSKISFDESLSFVQNKRKMADPNPHFKCILRQLEESKLLSELHEYCTSSR